VVVLAAVVLAEVVAVAGEGVAVEGNSLTHSLTSRVGGAIHPFLEPGSAFCHGCIFTG